MVSLSVSGILLANYKIYLIHSFPITINQFSRNIDDHVSFRCAILIYLLSLTAFSGSILFEITTVPARRSPSRCFRSVTRSMIPAGKAPSNIGLISITLNSVLSMADLSVQRLPST